MIEPEVYQYNRRFCIFKEEHRRLKIKESLLLIEVHLMKITVIDEFQTRNSSQKFSIISKEKLKKGKWNRNEILLDRFYKNMLIFLEKQQIFDRKDFKNGILFSFERWTPC